MTTIQSVLQSPTPGAKIALFRLDATPVGGSVMYFTQGATQLGPDGEMISSQPVEFGGIVYTPVDIEFSGFETSATGGLPSPKMKLSNANGVWQNILNAYGDLTGCDIQRVRTFGRFLDGEPEADSQAFMGPDMFRIERKTAENKTYIEWELSAAIDQEGKKLPGRVVIRDTCMWRYRRWDIDSSAFDYSKAQCPYVGSLYFDINDEPTTADKDKPSRRLSCCKARFGASAALPFGGFPGAARVAQ